MPKEEGKQKKDERREMGRYSEQVKSDKIQPKQSLLTRYLTTNFKRRSIQKSPQGSDLQYTFIFMGEKNEDRKKMETVKPREKGNKQKFFM